MSTTIFYLVDAKDRNSLLTLCVMLNIVNSNVTYHLTELTFVRCNVEVGHSLL